MTQTKINLSEEDVQMIVAALRQFSFNCYVQCQVYPNVIVNKAKIFERQMISEQLATRIQIAYDLVK